MRRSTWLLLVVLLLGSRALAAQTIQNATLRRAQQAFDNLDYREALALGRASLRERLTGFERARAYELLGFSYSGMDSILKAVDAFKQVVLIEPERDLDPNRTSPKALSAFQVALTQILVVRQLRVDSVEFIGGQGAVGIRYTVTQPSRVVTRITGGGVGGGVGWDGAGRTGWRGAGAVVGAGGGVERGGAEARRGGWGGAVRSAAYASIRPWPTGR